MRQDSGQFSGFDGLDNRKDLMSMLARLPSNERRAAFLKKVAMTSPMGRAAKIMPCDSVTAYFTLISICTGLRLDIQQAAVMLEHEVRKALT